MWLPHAARHCVTLTTTVLLWLFMVTLSAADDFSGTARNQTPDQLITLLQRASEAKMIAATIIPTTSRGRIRFHVTFDRNSAEQAWVFLVNVDRKRLNEADLEYKGQGYENTIQCSASAGGKRYYTALWTLSKSAPVSLVLPDGEIPESGPTSAAVRPLDEMLTAFLKEHNVSGATVAVAKDGRLVYSRGFGYADVAALQKMQPDAQMRIASVSKPITAVAIMMLIQQGKLTPGTLVVPLLRKAGLPAPTADERWNDVTVQHLLNHTGGWDREVSKDPMFQVISTAKALNLKKPTRPTDIIRWQLTKSLDFAPGQKYAYSNFGYSILGRLVAIVSGQRYEDWVAENILVARGMKDTRLGKTRLADRGPTEVRYHMQTMTKHAPFWGGGSKATRSLDPKTVPHVEEPYGRWDLEVMDSHGGWVSSAPDLLRFVAGLDDAGGPLMSKAMHDVMLSEPGPPVAGPIVWYGCGWSVRSAGSGRSSLGRHNIWHNGALAGTSALLVRRWDGFSWAVLFNTDRSTNGERLSSLIDGKLHHAIDSISEWPR